MNVQSTQPASKKTNKPEQDIHWTRDCCEKWFISELQKKVEKLDTMALQKNTKTIHSQASQNTTKNQNNDKNKSTKTTFFQALSGGRKTKRLKEKTKMTSSLLLKLIITTQLTHLLNDLFNNLSLVLHPNIEGIADYVVRMRDIWFVEVMFHSVHCFN